MGLFIVWRCYLIFLALLGYFGFWDVLYVYNQEKIFYVVCLSVHLCTFEDFLTYVVARKHANFLFYGEIRCLIILSVNTASVMHVGFWNTSIRLYSVEVLT